MSSEISLPPPLPARLRLWFSLVTVVAVPGLFLLDISRPLEYLDCILYLIPIATAWAWRGWRLSLLVSLVAILLTLAAAWITPPHPDLAEASRYNRLLIVLLFAAASTFAWWHEGRTWDTMLGWIRFEAIAQATNDAIWDYDVKRQRLWWSEGHRGLFGSQPTPSLEFWYEGLHPEDRARVTESFLGALNGTARDWTESYRYHKADGSYADIIDHGTVIRDQSGAAIRMVGGMRDITEQKLARTELRRINDVLRSLASQYRAVIDQSLAGILVLQNDRFRYVNPKLAEMCGATPQTLLSLESALASVYEDDRPHVAELLRKRLAGDPSAGPTRLRWKRPDGSVVWAEVHGSVAEYEGAPALIGVAIDITDRQRAEATQQELLRQLLAARERLEALSGQLMKVQEEERRQLARDLHDEIGQSLTVVKMNLLSIPNLQGSPEAVEAAREDSLRTMDSLIAHVRNLSLDLRPAMLDDLGLPETLRWFVARQCGRAGWTADVSIDDGLTNLPGSIALTCFRIVQECLTNAMRHAKATRIAVRASLSNGAIHLDIRDNGLGFNVTRALERGSRGASVGLLSLQERVRALDGTLTFESDPSRGTTILVHVPLPVSI